MSFYRVSLLDREGVVAYSAVLESLPDVAANMLAHADLIGHPATRHLLDADGELTIKVRGPGERELTDTEKTGLQALLEEFGATHLEDDSDGDSWTIDGPAGG